MGRIGYWLVTYVQSGSGSIVVILFSSYEILIGRGLKMLTSNTKNTKNT